MVDFRAAAVCQFIFYRFLAFAHLLLYIASDQKQQRMGKVLVDTFKTTNARKREEKDVLVKFDKQNSICTQLGSNMLKKSLEGLRNSFCFSNSKHIW